MRSTVLLAVIATVVLPLLAFGQSTLNFPRVIAPAEFRTTGFAIVNPASTNASVTFSLYRSDGVLQKASPQSIAAGGQFSKLASELFGEVGAAGWVQVISATTGLQGFWFGGDFRTYADGAEAAPSSTDVIVPLVAPQSEIDIANPSGADVTLRMNLFGQDGFDLDMPWPQLIRAKGSFKMGVASMFPRVQDISLATHMRITCQ